MPLQQYGPQVWFDINRTYPTLTVGSNLADAIRRKFSVDFAMNPTVEDALVELPDGSIGNSFEFYNVTAASFLEAIYSLPPDAYALLTKAHMGKSSSTNSGEKGEMP